MNERDRIMSCLEETPALLEGLVAQIPPDRLRERRIEGSWSIHEHACHVATGDRIGFIDRLRLFIEEERPAFVPLSGESFPPDHLLSLDLGDALESFRRERAELLALARNLDERLWEKEGIHPEYLPFTPHIMLRHRLLHEHFHMYRIEELWITRDEALRR